jgi:ATP-dependent exoDNAse (exonuclease V) beta subunit
VTPRPVADAAERTRALDPTRSFIVQAPAGSGKTGLLIQRYLRLLATVESPEEIVAITFTRKAAGEMRERVLKALAAARAGGEAPAASHEAETLALARAAVARDAAHDWRIAENPARLRIQTIDALCRSLVGQMPVLSRFGVAPDTTEDAGELYLEAARRTLELVETDQGVAADLELLLAHLDNDVARFETLLAGMLGKRDQWTRHLGLLHGLERARLEAALANARADALERLRSLIPASSRKELAAVAGFALGNLGGVFTDDLPGWAALADLLLTKADGWRKSFTKNEGFPAGKASETWKPRAARLVEMLGDDCREALADLRRLPPASYTDAQWAVLAAIGNLLRYALAELKLVFAAHRQVDFTEVAQAALRALGTDDEPTDLALALDYRIRHLLVDEFQDTSISQYRLIARLTAGWMPEDGRTVFVVGDPMQSIYRFREAEVGEFLRTREARALGNVALEPLRLSANFRSQTGIVEWVNRTFAQVMPAHEDAGTGAVPFAPSAAVRDPLPGNAVEVHPCFAGDDDESAEAARVVEVLEAIRRGDRDATVAVLVRTRSHLDDIVARLRDAGIRFRAIEIEPLGSRPVVQDLLALTRALAHPADRLAWLAVLRAPWCGLALADLAALVEGDRESTVWELANDPRSVERMSDDGRARLQRACAILGGALARRLRGGLRDRVEAAWLALGGPACVTDATDLEDASVYLDALEAAEVAGELPDRARFEAQVAELWALPDVHAVPCDVQIMTIHKAKGLEFDHVLVPGLGRAPRGDDPPLFVWTERPGPSPEAPDLLVAPIGEAGADPDAIYEWVRRLDAERDDHEAARLLYVAATRARRRLHLLGTVRRDEDGAPCPPPSRTLLARLWPVVEAEFVAAAAGAGTPAGIAPEPALPDQRLRRLPAGWQVPPPPASAVWRPPSEVARVEGAIEFSWVGETARHVGTVVHRWLQRIADDALAGWDEARVARLRPAVRADLAARGVLGAELDAAVERALAALRNAVRDERGRWMLGSHHEAASELRVTTLVDGRPARLVIDRVFRDAAGERWIVDYKTGGHEGADPEGFLDRERERYAAQLRSYARALAGPSRLGLYFPLLAGWREV